MAESKSDSLSKIRRIHVGGISNELVKDIKDLEKRFSSVGKIVKPFEVHAKPVVDYHFAYVTMDLTDAEYRKLKKLWDGIRFKGSKLTIASAKEDYMQRWERDARRQDTKIIERQRKAKIAEARDIRISQKDANPFKLSLVTKGRLRKTPRKTDLKNLTLRVNINGRLKIIKCKKNKLWGVAKDRMIRDLTYRFIAGEWRDGNEHVIDRLTKSVIIFDNSGVRVEAPEADMKDEVEEEFNNEIQKNNNVLEEMLGKYHFDKPVELDDDDEEDNIKGYDYELEHENQEEGDEEEQSMDISYNVPEKDCIHPSRLSIIEEYKKHETEINNPITNEAEDDDDDDFFKNLRPQVEYENDSTAKESKTPVHKETKEEKPAESIVDENWREASEEVQAPHGEDDDHDAEFLPSFGSSSQNPVDAEASSDEEEFIPTFGKSDIVDSSKNTTERLRDLLNSSAAIEHTRENDLMDVEVDVAVEQGFKKNENVGLFFSHFDSPFLVAQTQINKLRQINVTEDLSYDDWFWKNRGELNREFRKLRRDVLRRNKKKTKTASLI